MRCTESHGDADVRLHKHAFTSKTTHLGCRQPAHQQLLAPQASVPQGGPQEERLYQGLLRPTVTGAGCGLDWGLRLLLLLLGQGRAGAVGQRDRLSLRLCAALHVVVLLLSIILLLKLNLEDVRNGRAAGLQRSRRRDGAAA